MRALVTGGSGGIGGATALRLARDGFDVGVHYHTHLPAAEAVSRGVHGHGKQATLFRADLASPGGPAELASAVIDRWESVDVLVHNAGVYDRAPFDRLTPEDWQAALALNLTGPAQLTQMLLPSLRRSTGARIIFVSSVLAFTGSRWGAHYAAAKAGVLGLARSLARELAPSIRVNVVAPGSIDTAIIAGDTEAARQERSRTIPLGRVGLAEEVAEAIAFLASDRSSYVTGTTIHVNGGLRLD
ncbi:MAG: SDR family oxidoreductase [Thermoplasmata archaeon]|nr:SDR family oxidoreductase [Thermoplasmata archaeon]